MRRAVPIHGLIDAYDLAAFLDELIRTDVLDRAMLVERGDTEGICQIGFPGTAASRDQEIPWYIDPLAVLQELDGMCVQLTVRFIERLVKIS